MTEPEAHRRARGGIERAADCATDVPSLFRGVAEAVLDKTGVRSRRELAADLFFKHYRPRIERGSELTADGWFKDGG